MGRDNIAGVESKNWLHSIFLFPGRLIQWILYMGAGGKGGGYSKTRARTRVARSPLMTYFYSLFIWAWLGATLLNELELIPWDLIERFGE